MRESLAEACQEEVAKARVCRSVARWAARNLGFVSLVCESGLTSARQTLSLEHKGAARRLQDELGTSIQVGGDGLGPPAAGRLPEEGKAAF